MLMASYGDAGSDFAEVPESTSLGIDEVNVLDTVAAESGTVEFSGCSNPLVGPLVPHPTKMISIKTSRQKPLQARTASSPETRLSLGKDRLERCEQGAPVLRQWELFQVKFGGFS